MCVLWPRAALGGVRGRSLKHGGGTGGECSALERQRSGARQGWTRLVQCRSTGEVLGLVQAHRSPSDRDLVAACA